MRSPVPEYLDEVLRQCAGHDDGELADYIPELAAVDPDRLAVALCMPDGQLYGAGDVEAQFTIQSISKPFVYALALVRHGLEGMERFVGVEPSGDPFNEISLEASGRPRNPMVNIGAITTHALAGEEGTSKEELAEEIRRGLGRFAGRELSVDERVFESERSTAHRNLALAHLVRSYDVFRQDPRDVVWGYTRQCSVLVNVRDLAVMAMTLAAGGTNPVTGEQVIPRWVARQVLSVMSTCGMYDVAGDWMTDVGMPAKSGVGGGIMAALPGFVGAATLSPRLDATGTSVRGVRVFEKLSREMGMHMMDTPATATQVLRRTDEVSLTRGAAHRLQLQGPLYFGSTERLLRRMQEVPADREVVVVDLGRVTSVNDVARRMLLEGIRRLGEDGHEVVLVDPNQALPGRDADDVTAAVVDELPLR